MTTGVALLNFGEPESPERAAVLDYLERIFFANADLEEADSESEARDRARELAKRRAPALIEEYDAIGGSPLKPHSERQAALLADELRDRGYEAETYVGMQYTPPFIQETVDSAMDDGIERLIGLPVYPLCGPSTTVLALEELRSAIADIKWDVPVDELTGWHRHPGYTRLRADTIRTYVATRGIGLDGDAKLVFSAHGTPTHYLEAGSRYDIYVREFCDTVASLLDVDDYEIGYQNHENRDIPWTEPAIEDLLASLDADRVVVDPVSFMHEQSETLSELDVELREAAEARGIDFHRVPIPYDDERFIASLADLIEPFIAGVDPSYYNLRRCQCRDDPAAWCLNAPTS